MSKRYEFLEVKNDRYAIWYLDFGPTKRNKIGCYKIIDLYSHCRKYKYAFRFKPREGQSQEVSDSLIISNAIHYFNKEKNVFSGNRSLDRA